MSFTLPSLPWAVNALEPHISKETIDFHYGKHHAAYVKRLNELAAADPSLASKSLEEIVKTASGVAFNQAAQIWNHTFYWNSLSPNAGGLPDAPLKDAITKDFGSFDNFKQKFSAAAAGHFGSGWVWLTVNPAQGNKLSIEQSHDAGNPLRDGTGIPLLTCDVWEHAYYIDYRNARAQYIDAWWNLVNWKFAQANYKSAVEGSRK